MGEQGVVAASGHLAWGWGAVRQPGMGLEGVGGVVVQWGLGMGEQGKVAAG